MLTIADPKLTKKALALLQYISLDSCKQSWSSQLPRPGYYDCSQYKQETCSRHMSDVASPATQ